MFAFSEFFDHFRAECVEVLWLAAGDQPVIDVAFFIDPRAAGILDVGLKARPRRKSAALNRVGLN